MSKRTGPTNIVLLNLISELKKNSIEQNSAIWKRLAIDLERPARQRRVINLSKINMHAKDNEIIVVPGKVLGAGDFNKKITISAFQFSDGAKEKIEKGGSKIVSLLELCRENPSGKRIRILG